MAKDETAAFIKKCRDHILKFSGPFDELTEDAATELDRYLTEELVEVDNRSRTREEWSRVEAFRVPFFKRLALIGEYAKQAGLRRMTATDEPTAELTSLHLEDLREAAPLVQKISSTPYCTPDEPD